MKIRLCGIKDALRGGCVPLIHVAAEDFPAAEDVEMAGIRGILDSEFRCWRESHQGEGEDAQLGNGFS